VGVVTLAVTAWASRPSRRAAGIATGMAYCVALLVNGGLGGPVATSVAALPLGLAAAVVTLGVTAQRSASEFDRWVRAGLVLPGALLIGLVSGVATDPPWVPFVTVASVALSAPAVARFDHRWGDSGLPPVLLGVSAVGLFYTLPDPEEAAILVGVSMPLALLAAPPIRRRYGAAGSWMVAGVFVWTVGAGGYGRDSAVVGGLACLGLFLAAPIAEVSASRRRPSRRAAAMVAVHAATVLVAARVAGLQENGMVALGIAVVVIAMAAAVVWSIEHSGRLRDARSGDESPDQRPLTHRQEASPDKHDVGGEGDGHHRGTEH
jgi:hypothetical protein